jgi:complement component 1 Q subcomponent-binding protein
MTEFTVRVLKKGGKSGILVDATLIDSSFEFNNVNYFDDLNAAYDSIYLQQRPGDVYMGPDFNSLDERLQAEYTEFLGSLGVNEDLGSFMQVLSVDKDQRLYLRWLKNMNQFLH